MKLNKLHLLIIPFLLLIGCSKSEKNSDSTKGKNVEATDPMSNIGIGPIKSIKLDSEINPALVASGKKDYEALCTACHKVNEKFIGPAPAGIMERRNPVWIMNMILNPEEMTLKDPIARELLIEYNGAPMANQGLTEEQARAILEYFRTL